MMINCRIQKRINFGKLSTIHLIQSLNILERASKRVEAEPQNDFDARVQDEFIEWGIVDIKSSKELKTLLNRSEFESKTIPNISNQTEYERKECKLEIRRLFVIQFAAEWCGLCRSIQPMVDVSFNKISTRWPLLLCILWDTFAVTDTYFVFLGIG